MSPPPAQQTTPTMPQAFPTVPATGQLQSQQIPPIYVHLNQGGSLQQPTAGGRRGGPPMRGRWRRPQGPQQSRGPPPGQTTLQYQSKLQCWGCGQTGYMQRECPINPWTGPQNPGPGPHNPGTGPDSQNNGPWMGPAASLNNGPWMGPAAYWQ